MRSKTVKTTKKLCAFIFMIIAALFACGIFSIFHSKDNKNTVTAEVPVHLLEKVDCAHDSTGQDSSISIHRKECDLSDIYEGRFRKVSTYASGSCTHEVEYSFDNNYHRASCKKCGQILLEATSHIFNPLVVVTEPTYTSQGLSQRTCVSCGYIDRVYTDPLPCPHATKTYCKAVAATCAATGNVAYWYCNDCKKNLDSNDNVISNVSTAKDSSNHSKLIHNVRIEPTCMTAGTVEYWHCEGCNKNVDSNNEEITDVTIPKNPTAHKWDTTQPWLFDESMHYRLCIHGCGTKGGMEHSFNWITDKPATYTAPGLKYEECSTCKYKRNEQEIPMLVCEHANKTPHEAKEATCIEAGNVEYWHCADCNKNVDSSGAEIADVTIPIKDDAHDIVHHEGQEATCVAVGWGEYDTCSRCDYTTYSEIAIKPLNHKNLTHNEGKAATCVSTGNVEYWHCADCNKNVDSSGAEIEKVVLEIVSSAHDYSAEWSKDGTGHWHVCQNGCGAKGDFAGHTFGDYIIDKQPNCNEEGSQHKECTSCGYKTESEVIPADETAHDYATEWSTNGTGHWYECKFCGKQKDYAVHGWGAEWSTDKTNHWHECSTCGAKKDEAAHTAGDWIDDKKVTCTEGGSRHKVCTGCGVTVATETLSAKGHTLSPWQHDETAHWKQCSTCNEKVDSAGHNWSDWQITKQPTTAQTGEKRCSCTLCGQLKIETIAKLVEDDGGNGNVSDLPVLDDPNSSYKLEIKIDATGKEYTLKGKNKGYRVQLWIVNSQNDDRQEYNKQRELTLSLIVPDGMEGFTLYKLVEGGFEPIDESSYTVENGVLSIRTTLPEEFIFNTKAAPEKSGGIPWWVWLIVGVGGVALIAAIIVIIVVKKRKAVAEVQEYDDAELKAQLAEQNKRLEDLENRDDGGFGDIYDGDI